MRVRICSLTYDRKISLPCLRYHLSNLVKYLLTPNVSICFHSSGVNFCMSSIAPLLNLDICFPMSIITLASFSPKEPSDVVIVSISLAIFAKFSSMPAATDPLCLRNIYRAFLAHAEFSCNFIECYFAEPSCMKSLARRKYAFTNFSICRHAASISTLETFNVLTVSKFQKIIHLLRRISAGFIVNHLKHYYSFSGFQISKN